MFTCDLLRKPRQDAAMLRLAMWLILVPLGGCGANSDAPDSGPFGAPDTSPLLEPFEGNWAFDFDGTLEAQKTAGADEEVIEQMRKFYSENPQLGTMHPDINISGNVAVSSGVLSSEYRFFGMHEHEDSVCGKAWHHEDRLDPGDMSKCYVRLEIIDGHLLLKVRMKDGLPDMDDPDLISSPATESGSAADCDADSPPGTDWSEWIVYVFNRT